MNYNQVVEESVFKKYIGHGLNDNIEAVSLEPVQGENNGTVWRAFDVTFHNGESELRSRIFEFKYRPGAKDAKGVELDEKQQETNYLKRIKHLFSKIVGDSDKYDGMIAKAKDWESFVNILKSMVSNSKKFRLLCIDNGKGYPKIPDWNSGFAESMDVNPSKLQFNEAKYGKKAKPESVEQIVKSNDELPF